MQALETALNKIYTIYLRAQTKYLLKAQSLNLSPPGFLEMMESGYFDQMRKENFPIPKQLSSSASGIDLGGLG